MALTTPPVCDFGWKAPAFSLSEPDGASHSSTDFIGKKPALIMFICNHCPYVLAIAEKLGKVGDALMSKNIAVIAINANDWRMYPEDSPSLMPVFAKKYGFNFPYVVDETQAVAKEWDASCTPDFFGLNAKGELQYRGRFEDRSTSLSANNGIFDIEQNELYKAMIQIAETGDGPKQQTPSMGCSIKWRS